MQSVYLIANNENMSFDKFECISENAEIVTFNKNIWNNKFSGKTSIALNAFILNNQVLGFWGYDEFLENSEKYNKIYFIIPRKIEIGKYWNSVINNISESYRIYSDDFEYPYDKQPSAGYSTFKYFIYLEYQINLIGFTFNGFDCHDWTYEKDMITKHPNAIIY